MEKIKTVRFKQFKNKMIFEKMSKNSSKSSGRFLALVNEWNQTSSYYKNAFDSRIMS